MLGPGRGADGRKAGRSRGRGGQGGGRGVTFEGEESPEHVELLELPPGVPELLPVVCNGHRAQLALRTQRVVYRGQEMAPSRFEAMAGKDSAKKWKTSLFSCDNEGEPVQAMQDWLADRQLDRKALEALARNASQAAAYEEHARSTVEAVLAGLLRAVQAAELNGSHALPPAHSAAVEEGAALEVSGPGSEEHGEGERVTPGGEAHEQESGAVLQTGPRQLAPQPADSKLRPLELPDATLPAYRGSPGPAAANGQASGQQQGSTVGQSLASAHNGQEGQQRVEEEVAEYGRSVSPEAGALSAAAEEDEGEEQQRGAAQAQPLIKQEQQAADSPHTEQKPAQLGRKRSYDEACGMGGARSAGSADGAAAGSSRLRPPSTAASADLQRCGSAKDDSLGLRGEEQQPSTAGLAGTLAGGCSGGAVSAGGQEGSAERPGDAEGGRDGGDQLVVDVVCGRMQARFDARTLRVTLQSGRVVSPVEYERLSGRSAAKKWKWSIRLDVGGGVPGATLEEWLAEQGLEGPAAQPKASKGSPGLGGGPPGEQPLLLTNGVPPKARTHPSDCGCVICKQARRSGKVWAGMPAAAARAGSAERSMSGGGLVDCAREALQPPGASGAGAQPGSPAGGAQLVQEGQQPAYSLQRAAAPSGSPRPRDGKRAYLSALPQLATAGPTPHQLHEVPLSRCWTPDDWVAQRRRQAALAEARALQAQGRPPRTADAGAIAGFGANTWVDSLAPKVSLGPGVHDWRLYSVREKLELCAATERARIAFGKSGIHGWGLFARVPLKQDTMVTEYRGVLVRASAAEAREARYRAQGRDCYLFNLDDAHVLDATQAGAISRFTNHSCSPSMYSKILNVDGRQRLVFFARQDIEAGQELTFNYRFERGEGEERLPCSCGAPDCTGFLN